MRLSDLKEILEKINGIDVEEVFEDGDYGYFKQDCGHPGYVFALPLYSGFLSFKTMKSMMELEDKYDELGINEICLHPDGLRQEIIYEIVFFLFEPIEGLRPQMFGDDLGEEYVVN